MTFFVDGKNSSQWLVKLSWRIFVSFLPWEPGFFQDIPGTSSQIIFFSPRVFVWKGCEGQPISYSPCSRPSQNLRSEIIWLVVEPPIWKICLCQIGSFPQIGMNIFKKCQTTSLVMFYSTWQDVVVGWSTYQAVTAGCSPPKLLVLCKKTHQKNPSIFPKCREKTLVTSKVRSKKSQKKVFKATDWMPLNFKARIYKATT